MTPFRQLSSLLTSYGLLLLATGMFTTLLSLRTKQEGFAAELTGLIMGGYFCGIFIGARYTAAVVHQVGHIRAFGVFASLISMTPLFHMLFVSPPLWFILRLVAGFSMAGLIVVTESWLNARAENHNRGTLLSIYMIVSYIGAGSAQLLLMLDDPSGYRLFLLASVIFSVSLIPVLLTRTSAPLPETPAPLQIAPMLRTSPVGFWGSLAAGLINSSFYTLGPIFAQDSGLSRDQIAWFMAFGILGGLILQIPLGRLSDRIERRRVIAAAATGTTLCCAALATLAVQSAAIGWLMLGSFSYGCLAFTLYSLAAAHANDWGHPERRMQTSGALLAGFGIGAIAGPLVSGTFMGELGPAGLFVFSGLVAFSLACYSLIQSTLRQRSGDQTAFVPQPGSQYISAELFLAAREEQLQEESLSEKR